METVRRRLEIQSCSKCYSDTHCKKNCTSCLYNKQKHYRKQAVFIDGNECGGITIFQILPTVRMRHVYHCEKILCNYTWVPKTLSTCSWDPIIDHCGSWIGDACVRFLKRRGKILNGKIYNQNGNGIYAIVYTTKKCMLLIHGVWG